MQAAESEPRGDHQYGSGDKGTAVPESSGNKAGQDRQSSRAEECRCGDGADLKGAETQLQEVCRQEDTHVSVGNGAKRLADQQAFGVCSDRWRE